MGPELSMVMCKTMKETRDVETALAIASWKCGTDGYPTADSAVSEDSDCPMLFVLSQGSKTYCWWRLGTTPAGYADAYEMEMCGLLGVKSLKVFGAEAALKEFEPAKREKPRIDAAWLKKNEACPEGQTWFFDTFGGKASVSVEAVEAALKTSDHPISWTTWLDLKLKG